MLTACLSAIQCILTVDDDLSMCSAHFSPCGEIQSVFQSSPRESRGYLDSPTDRELVLDKPHQLRSSEMADCHS